MFILLEKCRDTDSDDILFYDAMGYTYEEKKAMNWVAKNREYRTYKYCSDKEL